jgi:energy-coupling factor transporter ATP-binding protein EcfA2
VGSLDKIHGEVMAAGGVPFEAREGGIFGLLGPNGAGKTTTIRCLCGLVEPTAGRLRIGGADVQRDPVAALGGCWWPAEIMPLWAQRLSMALPTGWVVDALHRLMHPGAAPVEVLPQLAALGRLTLICAWGLARLSGSHRLPAGTASRGGVDLIKRQGDPVWQRRIPCLPACADR